MFVRYTFSLPPAISFTCMIALLVPSGSCVFSDFRMLLFCDWLKMLYFG